MTYQGHVQNGVIVLDENVILPEGTQVRVLPIKSPADECAPQEGPPLGDRLKPFIGSAKGLPPDASQRIDEFLYGGG